MITGCSIAVVYMLWEHEVRVRLPAARQKIKNLGFLFWAAGSRTGGRGREDWVSSRGGNYSKPWVLKAQRGTRASSDSPCSPNDSEEA